MNPKTSSDNPVKPEAADESSEHIHMPPPSWSPIVLALGMAAAAFGIVLGGAILIIGVILLLGGLGTWLYDEIKHAAAADEDAARADSADMEAHNAT